MILLALYSKLADKKLARRNHPLSLPRFTIAHSVIPCIFVLSFLKSTPMQATRITVETTINTPIEKVWQCWTQPEHITKWNAASEDWHSPSATNDLRAGGSFSFRMEARDGSVGFDFAGVYDTVALHQNISYTLGDHRKVNVLFRTSGNSTIVQESFDAENIHSHEMQRAGWQAILDNFKKYVESI